MVNYKFYLIGPIYKIQNIDKNIEIIAIINKGVDGYEKGMEKKATILKTYLEKGEIMLIGPHLEQTFGLESFFLELVTKY
jgi:glutamine amidotransferase-like uncharacterized protein